MAEYRRAEYAALRVRQICDGHFHGGRAGSEASEAIWEACLRASRRCWLIAGRDVPADSGAAEPLDGRQYSDLCVGDALSRRAFRKRHMALLGVRRILSVGAFYAWSAPYRRESLLSFRDPFRQDERRGLSAFAIAYCAGLRRTVWYGAGAGTDRSLPICRILNPILSLPLSARTLGLMGCLTVIALFVLFVFAGSSYFADLPRSGLAVCSARASRP